VIEAIFIAKIKNAEQEQLQSADLIGGKGIVGDRAFGKIKNPGQNITFVELEQIDDYNRTFHQNIPIYATRRNVITKNVRLNELVGKEFAIGAVKFIGVELCEPCSKLGGLLETNTITKPQVVKALVHKMGLRADVLSDGVIEVGMEFRLN